MKRLVFLIVVLLLGFYVGWPAYSGYELRSALERKDVSTVGRKIDFPSVRKSLEPIVNREVADGMDRYLKDLGPLAGMLAPVLKSQYGPKVVEATINTLVTPENVVRLYAERDNVQAAAEVIVMEELNKSGGLFSVLFASSRSTDGQPGLADRMRLPGGLGGFGESVRKELDKAGAGASMPDLRDVLTKMIEQRRAARAAQPKTEAASASKGGDGGFGVRNVKSFGFNGPLAMEVGVASSGAASKPDFTAEMAFRSTDWKLTRLVPGG